MIRIHSSWRSSLNSFLFSDKGCSPPHSALRARSARGKKAVAARGRILRLEEFESRLALCGAVGQICIDDGGGGVFDPSLPSIPVNAGGPYSLTDGQSISLSGSATGTETLVDPDFDAWLANAGGLLIYVDPDPGNNYSSNSPVVSYAWDFNYQSGDFDTDATGSTPTFSGGNRSLGTRTVALLAADQTGAQGFDTASLTITDDDASAPSVALSGSSGTESHAASQSFSWSATDASGIASTSVTVLKNGSVVYTNSNANANGSFSFNSFGTGSFEIQVSATDGDNDRAGDQLSSSVSRSVTVTNASPNAGAGGPYSVHEGSSVKLIGSGTDNDGDSLTYAWDLDNNSTYETSGQSPTFSAASLDGPLTRTVRLRVCDVLNACNTDTATVEVANVAPSIGAVSNTGPVNEGSSVTVVASATDPAGVRDPLTYMFDFDNDNTFEESNLSGQAQHVFDDNGTFQVNIRVEDGDGGVADQTTTIVVNNVAPAIHLEPVAGISENGMATLSGQIVDASSADTFTLDLDWDPNNTQSFSLTASLQSKSVNGIDWNPATRRFSIDHQFLDDNPTGTSLDNYTISATVTDDDAGVGSGTQTAMVQNLAPNLVLDPVAPIDENGVATFSGAIVDAGTLDTFTLDIGWGDSLSPNNAQSFSLGDSSLTKAVNGIDWNPATRRFSVDHQFLDDNPTGTSLDNYTISATVTDDDTGVGTADALIRVDNFPPVINTMVRTSSAGTNVVDEGSVLTLDGTFTDPGTLDTHDLLIDWGDGTPPTVLNLTSGERAFSAIHVYADDRPSASSADSATIRVTVTDDDSESGTQTGNVLVRNVAPVVTGLNLDSAVIDENDVATLSGDIVDPGTPDTFTLEVNWGDGSSVELFSYPAGTTFFSETHRYLDDDPTGTPIDSYTISVTVTDDDTGQGSETTTIVVDNVAPRDILIDAGVQEYVFAVGTPMGFGGSFGDVGTLDSHTAEWTFSHVLGLGVVNETRQGAVTEVNGSGTVFNSFTFDDDAANQDGPGVYTVTLTVADDDTGAKTSDSRTFVVYDPSAGFVTGGGWIHSPNGALIADASLVGRATFGFVSKYQKGMTTPTGQTEFQFKVADLNFLSSSYDWLVVAGARAQYKGTGTINGQGNYGFMLTAIDGQTNGGGGVDRFRIKIWDQENGDALVYDNQIASGDTSDDSTPSTVLGGGQVVIHTGGKKLTLAGTEGVTMGANLSSGMLDAAVSEATGYWAAAGIAPDRLATLGGFDVELATLPGTTLGLTSSSTNKIWLDIDAGGRGWTLDGARAGVDLHAAVTHEFGHALGFDHDVLGESLAPGERHLPDAQLLDNNDKLKPIPQKWFLPSLLAGKDAIFERFGTSQHDPLQSDLSQKIRTSNTPNLRRDNVHEEVNLTVLDAQALESLLLGGGEQGTERFAFLGDIVFNDLDVGKKWMT